METMLLQRDKILGSSPETSLPIIRRIGLLDKLKMTSCNGIASSPPSRARIWKPWSCFCWMISRELGWNCQGRLNSEPRAVFETFGFSGVGVIPHKCKAVIPALSLVRNMEPTLKAERIFSSTTSMTCCAGAGADLFTFTDS